MNPEPRLFCLNCRCGVSPKNRSKKSSPPKLRSKGDPWPKGERNPPPRIVLVVLIFTTEGFSFSARSAKDKGARGTSPGETEDAICTSGPGADGAKEERRTSTIETTNKPIKKAKRNMIKVLRCLLYTSDAADDLLCV